MRVFVGLLALLLGILPHTAFSQVKKGPVKPVPGTDTVSMFPKVLLDQPLKYPKILESKFQRTLIPHFDVDSSDDIIVLENGYAQSKIINPEEFFANDSEYTFSQVDIIYSLYPIDTADWLTNYHVLLTARLKELFKIAPYLNNKRIKWRLVLQTDCKSSEEAKELFHGIVIKYAIKSGGDPKNKIPQPKDSITVNKHLKKMKDYVKRNGTIKDSVVYDVLERHPEWKNCLVVMDWTGSMYPFGSQVMLWHAKHIKTSGMKYYCFFNDGDRKPDSKKVLGKTGGIYFEEADNLDRVMALAKKVQSKGTGGDVPENDLEAILKSLRKWPDVKEIILIADNSACIRDFSLIDSITKPVHVIVCGVTNNVNPQLLNLAHRTRGSLHTIDNDYDKLYKYGMGVQVSIGGYKYILNSADWFELVESRNAINFYECDDYYPMDYQEYQDSNLSAYEKYKKKQTIKKKKKEINKR